MYYVFKSDNPPAWLDHLGTVCGTVTLASEDGQQVSVSTAILLAMSPLVRSILSDIHPADYGPLVMVLAVCGDVLHVVGEILSKGEVNVKDERFEGEVQLFFKRIGVELFLNCTKVEVIKSDLISEIEVKDEAISGEINISEIEILVNVEFVDDSSADVTSNEEKNLDDTLVKKETKKKSSEMEEKCEVCGCIFQDNNNLKKHWSDHDTLIENEGEDINQAVEDGLLDEEKKCEIEDHEDGTVEPETSSIDDEVQEERIRRSASEDIDKELRHNAILLESSDLPDGWTRLKVPRQEIGKFDKYVQAPEGKRFNCQKKVDRYIAQKQLKVKVNFRSSEPSPC